jgi:hypothetical protein
LIILLSLAAAVVAVLLVVLAWVAAVLAVCVAPLQQLAVVEHLKRRCWLHQVRTIR